MVEFIEEVGKRDKYGKKFAKYKCECGNVFETRIASVNAGITTSCGCYRRKNQSQRASKMWKEIKALQNKG